MLSGLTAEFGPAVTATGRGCFRAVHIRNGDEPLDVTARDRLIADIRDAGAIVHPGPGGIQLIPPLIYRPDEVDELATAVTTGLRRTLRPARPHLTAGLAR